MFNMSNLVIPSLYEFIENFYKDCISNIPNENISALTQQTNAVFGILTEDKALPLNNTYHVLT